MFIFNLKYRKEKILIYCLIFFMILAIFIVIFCIFAISFLLSHTNDLLLNQADYFVNDNTKQLFLFHKELIESLLALSIFLCCIFGLIFIFLLTFIIWFKKSKRRDELLENF